MNDQIKIGDVVELNSGSTKMTVTYVNENGTVDVTWFNTTTQSLDFKNGINAASFFKIE